MSHNRSGTPYWCLSGYYFLFFAAIGIYMPYWSLYLRSINLSVEQIGIISAIVVGTKIFSTYLWGWVVDYTGYRVRVIQLTSLCAALLFSGVLLLQNFPALACLMLFFSLFWNASLPQIDAATLSATNKAVHGYSFVRLWGSVGFVTIGVLGIVFDSVSIRYVPHALLTLFILLWLLTLLIPESPPQGSKQTHEALHQVIRQPQVCALLIACFLMLASHGPYYTFYSIYLEDAGYSRSFIGKMWVLSVVAEIILFLLMQRLIIIYGLRKLFLFSLFAAILRWFLIACFVDNLILLSIAQLAHAATFGMYHAAAIQYVHQYFKGDLQGRGQGLYSSSSFGAGFAVGSLLAGYGWQTLGAVICFGIASATAMVGMVIAWLFVKDQA